MLGLTRHAMQRRRPFFDGSNWSFRAMVLFVSVALPIDRGALDPPKAQPRVPLIWERRQSADRIVNMFLPELNRDDRRIECAYFCLGH
jgi:hypothetical protein